MISHQKATRVLRLVAEGRVSIGRAAELRDLTIYDLHRLAETYGIELGTGAMISVSAPVPWPQS